MELAMYIVWGTIVIIALIIELCTFSFIGWSASISSLMSLITHAITKGNPIWIEIFIFFFLWVFLWILFIIFIKKKREKMIDMDDGYLGFLDKTFIAYKGNDNEYGQIKINDKFFRFKSKSIIKKGDKVRVVKIKGVTFNVEKEK